MALDRPGGTPEKFALSTIGGIGADILHYLVAIVCMCLFWRMCRRRKVFGS